MDFVIIIQGPQLLIPNIVLWGSAPRSSPLPFQVPVLAEKVPLAAYTVPVTETGPLLINLWISRIPYP